MTTAAAAREALMVKGLRVALEPDAVGIDVHYMPTINIATGMCTGFEALARWNDPDFGSVPPDVFVPLAEQVHLAASLGDRVRHQVIQDLEAGLLAEGRVAVNVSALELADPTFADMLLDLLEDSGLPVGTIGVEITETAIMTNYAQTIEALLRLQAAGIPVALDDFGTGHASLDYLARLPCDIVKIDRYFIAGVDVDAGIHAIVAGVIAMAHATGHTVIAEGVETQSQLATLAELGCDEAQGFLFGRPSRPPMSPSLQCGIRSQPHSRPIDVAALSPTTQSTLAAQTLVDLLRDLGDAADIAAAFAAFVEALRPIVDFTGGSVQVLGSDGIRLAAAHPPPTAEALASRIPAGQGVGGAVIATGQLRYLPDITIPAAAVAAGRRARSTTRHTRSYLAVPLFDGSTCIGLVQLDSVRREAFDDSIHLLLAACSAPLSAAVSRALRRS